MGGGRRAAASPPPRLLPPGLGSAGTAWAGRGLLAAPPAAPRHLHQPHQPPSCLPPLQLPPPPEPPRPLSPPPPPAAAAAAGGAEARCCLPGCCRRPGGQPSLATGCAGPPLPAQRRCRRKVGNWWGRPLRLQQGARQGGSGLGGCPLRSIPCSRGTNSIASMPSACRRSGSSIAGQTGGGRTLLRQACQVIGPGCLQLSTEHAHQPAKQCAKQGRLGICRPRAGRQAGRLSTCSLQPGAFSPAGRSKRYCKAAVLPSPPTCTGPPARPLPPRRRAAGTS